MKKQYKIDLERLGVEEGEEGVQSWRATIKELPAAHAVAPTVEQAVRIVKAKALHVLSVMVETGNLDFSELEISRCCHPKFEQTLGWTHCYVCGQGVPHGE